ncbi:MAG: CBS domain-containing protein, partial [Thermoproteus sp.]
VDDQGRPVGLLMSSRVLELLSRCGTNVKVGDVMITNPPVVNASDDIYDVISAMLSNNIGRLLVVDDEGKLVGIVTRTDILSRIASLESIS